MYTEIYKGFYVQPILVDKTYCMFMDWYDISIQKDISDICDYINNKYKSIIFTPMCKKPVSGLVIKEGDIAKIAKEVYDLYNSKDLPCRVVYGEGTLDSDPRRGDINGTIHQLWGDLVIRIGRKLDELKNQTGIFEV
jgi:hypothetical protein